MCCDCSVLRKSGLRELSGQCLEIRRAGSKASGLRLRMGLYHMGTYVEPAFACRVRGDEGLVMSKSRHEGVTLAIVKTPSIPLEEVQPLNPKP